MQSCGSTLRWFEKAKIRYKKTGCGLSIFMQYGHSSPGQVILFKVSYGQASTRGPEPAHSFYYHPSQHHTHCNADTRNSS
jgi:hypothetical protein